MENFLLSICIPTYNRAETIAKCLENILLYKDNDIEIIVSDNCSSDNTEEIVKSYKDKRILYIRNNYNTGPDNLLGVMKHARGDFVYFTSDEDDIIIEKIKKIIKICKNSRNAAVIAGSVINKSEYRNNLYTLKLNNTVYNRQIDILSGFAFSYGYFSGILLNNRYIKIILKDFDAEKNNRKFGNYVNHYLFTRLSEYGSFIVLGEPFSAHVRNAKRDCSIVLRNGKLHFAPEGRIEQIRFQVNWIKNLKLSEKDNFKLYLLFLLQGYRSCIVEWYNTLYFDKLIQEELKKNVSGDAFKIFCKQKSKYILSYREVIKNFIKVNRWINDILKKEQLFRPGNVLSVLYIKYLDESFYYFRQLFYIIKDVIKLIKKKKK